MDTNTGESPGHQSQSQKLGNSSSEEEMGHWTLTGVEPRDYDDDDVVTIMLLLLLFLIFLLSVVNSIINITAIAISITSNTTISIIIDVATAITVISITIRIAVIIITTIYSSIIFVTNFIVIICSIYFLFSSLVPVSIAHGMIRRCQFGLKSGGRE